MDLTFGTETLDELLVFLVFTVLGKATQTGSASVQGLGALVESLLQTSVDHGLFQNLFVDRLSIQVFMRVIV